MSIHFFKRAIACRRADFGFSCPKKIVTRNSWVCKSSLGVSVQKLHYGAGHGYEVSNMILKEWQLSIELCDLLYTFTDSATHLAALSLVLCRSL